ncbi:S41 family peptidase (plasmid) [Streptomyces sp. BI20]|uniref:S41 family peptidase n=1 Tax=Streptomyces sp. BI20 TaxID=3403460 RepID=UPI003C722155
MTSTEPTPTHAADPADAAPLGSTEWIVTGALERIAAGYVFPEKVPAVETALRAALAAGAYAGLDGPELCARVTADLQGACPDPHLRLLWSEDPQPVEPADGADDGAAAFRALLRAENQGVRRVEHLPGNIGLIALGRIADADAPGSAAIGAAFRLVADTEGLVLDLRDCLGGIPEGAALWVGHFFGADEPTHLHDIHHRLTDTTVSYHTAADLPGPRYLGRPVRVLTGPVTFSGGEDVAYTLQSHKRALVVGAPSRGGAHPTVRHPLTPHVMVTVPVARSISAVTGGNWEGTGVLPDLPIAPEEALSAALDSIRADLDAARDAARDAAPRTP